MSKVEEICRLLDERGIRYRIYDEDESSVAIAFGWTGQHDDYRNQICVFGDSFISATRSYLTPEQAVETALGRGTCHIVSDGEGWWECYECGASIVWDDPTEPPGCNYCPNCGRKVVRRKVVQP